MEEFKREDGTSGKPARQTIGLYDDSRLMESINLHTTLDENKFENEQQNLNNDALNEDGTASTNTTRNVLLRMEKTIMKSLFEINYVMVSN